MKKEGLNIKDKVLVMTIAIVYATAQVDLLQEQIYNLKK